MPRLALGVAAALVIGAAPVPGSLPDVPHVRHGGGAAVTRGPAAAVHDLHETYADLAIEDRTVGGRIRFFKRDLERVLGPILGADQVSLTPGPEADALVLRYLRQHLRLEADGEALDAQLLDAAEIRLGHHPGWQLTLTWEAEVPVDELHVRNTLLFELHDDQRNVMRFVRLPGETRETVTTEAGHGEVVVGGGSTEP
jgi:hypothetical protein